MTIIRQIIRQTEQEQQNSRNELRMMLTYSDLDYRNQFRNSMEHQLNHSTQYRIPWVERLENLDVIDHEGIIEINNSTSSERRRELMQNIINYENVSDNSYYFIANSSNQVRTYLHDLLLRSSNSLPIVEEDLYRIGNIFLYTISNINIENIELFDIIQYLRENFVRYNTDQIIGVLSNNIPVYNEYLDSVHLASEAQLQERTKEFNQEVNERLLLNRRRILYAGFGLIGIQWL